MRDIGGLIWVILVIIAIFSSVRKSIRQATQATDAQGRPAVPPRPVVPPRQAVPLRPAAEAPVTPLQRALQLSPVIVSVVEPPAPSLIVPPQAPVTPAPAPARATPATPPHDPFHAESIQRRPSSGLLGGIFEDKNAILRAVVAAEVLGKPKALQEQSIWSPRHSEPSI